jgi:SAM-dependent methyltransferase
MDYWREDPFAIDSQKRFRGSPQALPIQSDSVDVVVLPHTLEFADSPHAVLREVERILIPEGHVIILAFNPWSLWSFWRLASGWRGEAPWCGTFISMTRLRDWLTLLGLEAGESQGYFFQPPIRRDGVLERLRWLDRLCMKAIPVFGASNIIVAQKRVVTLTPIRPRWRPKRQQVVSGLEPTNRVARQRFKRANHGRSG